MGHLNSEEDKTKDHLILTKGTLVSHYEIIERIGSGGMGEVYLANDKALERKVALKFLSSIHSTNEELRNRFEREARAAARLNHPNIVTIFEVGLFKDRPFFAMEYLKGKTIADLIEEQPISLRQALEIGCQLCEALAEIHRHKIVHRDLKPANIVMDNNQRPRILDFGIASVSDESDLTKTGTTPGTIAYMSPEQIEAKDLDNRSDLFSLGVVLYEMVTGLSPFRKENQAATINAIMNISPEPVLNHVPDIPNCFDRIIFALLEKDRDRRPKDALAIKVELTDCLNSLSGELAARENTAKQTSIAVLPFANLSANPEQEFFCDGIAEDIINDLSQISVLKVVARTSAFAFKGRNEDIRSIGRKLGVSYLLEGSVQRAGGQIRVTAQLVKVSDGYHLWSERYDREFKDVFAIQDEITHQIVESLKIQLNANQTEVRSKRRSDNLEAYELYLKGRYFLNQRTKNSLRQAQENFQAAIKIDPGYALAISGLADSYFLQYAYLFEPALPSIARAIREALKALDINPELGEAYATLGGIATYSDWDWETARDWFEKAKKLAPSYPTAHQWYAELLMFLHEDVESEICFKRALELDPLSESAMTMYSVFCHKKGRLEESAALLEKAVEQGSENEFTFVSLAFVYFDQGRIDEAKDLLRKARQLSNDSPYSLTMWGHLHALTGEIAETESALEKVRSFPNEDEFSPSCLGILSYDLGDKETAFRNFETALRKHDHELIFITFMPYFSNLREDSKLAALLNTIGLHKST
ncbi:MAG: protein kinase [candidate division Zixibacteria bacterium]|nr:protein kinase [candidate division Zixibacteria bacterium]